VVRMMIPTQAVAASSLDLQAVNGSPVVEAYRGPRHPV
jgi:hypothetical protein